MQAQQGYTPDRRPDHTADRADAFVRRQSLWSTLIDHFRHHRPDEQQLTQVSTVAEVAIDQVFSAYNLTDEQCRTRHGQVKDYAECAALYGYVLGYWQAQGERDRAAVAAQAGSK
jgi:hypothetical protein